MRFRGEAGWSDTVPLIQRNIVHENVSLKKKSCLTSDLQAKDKRVANVEAKSTYELADEE